MEWTGKKKKVQHRKKEIGYELSKGTCKDIERWWNYYLSLSLSLSLSLWCVCVCVWIIKLRAHGEVVKGCLRLANAAFPPLLLSHCQSNFTLVSPLSVYLSAVTFCVLHKQCSAVYLLRVPTCLPHLFSLDFSYQIGFQS